MKKFNKIISIEVQVDSIAQLLLDNLNPEFKHKEIVAEAIVGRMMNDGSLSFLYNSLNGYPCDINFKIGDELITESPLRVYGHWTPESIEKNDTVYGNVSQVKICDINPYADNKLCIEYQVPNRKGELVRQTQWVNHLNWSKIPVVLS